MRKEKKNLRHKSWNNENNWKSNTYERFLDVNEENTRNFFTKIGYSNILWEFLRQKSWKNRNWMINSLEYFERFVDWRIRGLARFFDTCHYLPLRPKDLSYQILMSGSLIGSQEFCDILYGCHMPSATNQGISVSNERVVFFVSCG